MACDSFLKIRCPNKPTPESSFECRGQLAGPSIEFLNTYDFETPIVDLRYCHRCGSFVEVTILSKNSQPSFRVFNDIEKSSLKLVSVEEVFGGYTVTGRNVKRGELSNG